MLKMRHKLFIIVGIVVLAPMALWVGDKIGGRPDEFQSAESYSSQDRSQRSLAYSKHDASSQARIEFFGKSDAQEPLVQSNPHHLHANAGKAEPEHFQP